MFPGSSQYKNIFSVANSYGVDGSARVSTSAFKIDRQHRYQGEYTREKELLLIDLNPLE